MQASVIISTWNRSALLHDTLAQFEHLAVPETMSWELLVVDNNSDDATQAVVRSLERDLPLRYVFEPTQGLSYARNRGVKEARGDLLLFTDDDVLVSSAWLTSYVRAASEFPEAVFFGGPIEPWFEREPPTWVKKNFGMLQGAYAVRSSSQDAAQGTRLLQPGELPFGANFAVRSSVLDPDPFSVRLGRTGAELLSGEETELLQRLADRAGSRGGVWVSAASVRHWIPAERMTVRYLDRFYQGLGRTEVLREPLTKGRTAWGIPLWLFRRLVQSTLLASVLYPFKNGLWLSALKESARSRGMVQQIRRQPPR